MITVSDNAWSVNKDIVIIVATGSGKLVQIHAPAPADKECRFIHIAIVAVLGKAVSYNHTLHWSKWDRLTQALEQGHRE
jgi:hypothetical protein